MYINNESTYQYVMGELGDRLNTIPLRIEEIIEHHHNERLNYGVIACLTVGNLVTSGASMYVASFVPFRQPCVTKFNG